MVFTPGPLFKDIACPAGESCKILSCIFNHEFRPQKDVKQVDESTQPGADSGGTDGAEPLAKRRKITYEKLEDKPLSRAEKIRADLAESRAQKKAADQEPTKPVPPTVTRAPKVSTTSTQAPSTLKRPISPPSSKDEPRRKIPTTDQSVAARKSLSKATNGTLEALNPRMVTPAPDSHANRVRYLQTLHSDMCRLNRELIQSKAAVNGIDPPNLQSFKLSNQELIDWALTEEEYIARTSQKIYANVMRNRLSTYRRMTTTEWLKSVQSIFFSTSTQLSSPDSNAESSSLQQATSILDGLQSEEMASILTALVIKDLGPLEEFGYVIQPPAETTIAEAKVNLERGQVWEDCERCGTRFQVFPDRDPETGRLTSRGPCHYHWARKTNFTRQKTDAYTGGKSALYGCCGQEIGSTGCTTHEDHVFKSTSPVRLATVLPFITTPRNEQRRKAPNGSPVTAVVFDCEMGYTTLGLELIRLTAINWYDRQPLVDVLVRPYGTVIDLNTRFSGVKPEQFISAPPYHKDNSQSTLQVANDPAAARAILCEFLSGDEVPLMGHAIDNDLNATRLCHPAIVDTVMLYPHHCGLPRRLGLKTLSNSILGRSIQMAGSDGHDSHEDAVATADLITAKAAELASTLFNARPKIC